MALYRRFWNSWNFSKIYFRQLNIILFVRVWIIFVCLEFFVPLEYFSLIWSRHHYRWRAAHFDLCSALVSCEGSLACHTYCDMGNLFITFISEDPWHSHLMSSVLAVERSLPVLTTYECRIWVSYCSHFYSYVDLL